MEEIINIDILDSFKSVNEKEVDYILHEELSKLNKKIIVLDDDPTGVQTVNNIHVYTNWNIETIREGFAEKNNLFFILTNSRGLTVPATKQIHGEIAENIVKVSKETGLDFIIISRSDSTLRGHYPLETQVLKEDIENETGKIFDGEIIYPFFKEGGRYTINNIHYVKDGTSLVPAGMTEFAKDKSFGYKESNLTKWCEEKSLGQYKAEDVVSISMEELRSLDFDSIEKKLLGVKNFGKVIVNSIDYVDVKVFAVSYIRAVRKGKEFMLRSAAAITKILGGVADKGLLTKDELVSSENKNGGIILIGSHVNKTTLQLNELKKSKYPIEFIEFNAHSVLQENGLEEEVKRVIKIAEENIINGRTVAIFTSRKLVEIDSNDKDKILEISVKISEAVTSIIGKLNVRPNFIIAKGGITSSDVGTKALKVVKALVMGQIKPGIPVWMTGEESKFPNMPYIIFPGNVGEITTLKEAVETLMG